MIAPVKASFLNVKAPQYFTKSQSQLSNQKQIIYIKYN